MAATLGAVPSMKLTEKSETEAARELVRMAKEQGLALTGPDGLLKQLTKTVIETALDEEMTEHLGYDKHDAGAKQTANSRNGTRSKTVLTETTGPVEIDVPRDRDGSFEPVIVKKRQRRLNGVDEMVLSLYAKGLTTGEISAHFAEIYGASVSKETVSRITDRVLEEMAGWQNRPLDEVYTAIFIDAIVVKIRDGQVANRPIYAAIGVTLDGEKDILGLWAGTGGEGAKFWMSVLTDIKNRGVKDSFFLVCDVCSGVSRHRLATHSACISRSTGTYTVRAAAPTVPASHASDARSSRPQNPKSRITELPARSLSIAVQINRPSTASRMPFGSEWLKSGTIHSSGLSRTAAVDAASSLARVVLPAPTWPTIRTSHVIPQTYRTPV